MFRQGDVLLVPTTVPEGARELPVSGERLVLAEGELTGHAHEVDAAGVRLLGFGGRRFVCVEEEGTLLTHQEHAAIPLPSGVYEVIRQAEYSPSEAVRVRRVRD